MKIIVGLGNPEDQHSNTRHNAGFMTVDALATELGIKLENSSKLFSKVGKNDQYVLAQPQTYMNDSGKAVRAVLDFFKLNASDLMVVHDDLDIALGSYKIQQGTGPKSHNGLLSIYSALDTEDFTHVRIGIEDRDAGDRLSGKDYVLQPLSKEELQALQTTIAQVIEELLP